MKECLNLEENKRRCTCTYEPCSRKGMCCECIRYHWKINELPGCMFSPEIEKTYDRSIERFMSFYGNFTEKCRAFFLKFHGKAKGFS